MRILVLAEARQEEPEREPPEEPAKERARKDAPALLGGDAAARMLDEADAADRVVAEVDRREVLAALIAVVVWRHHAQRRAVREREGFPVEKIGEQDVRPERVLERQH